ncbi:fibronectin type III domain-containing protein [Natrinema sp. SYSU A 869]|uniref:fibronectin type III domain-containing protein n=1 Tax=Natrinema sp. SYSU A 869 TaxID=2871694 RepID=UPI001CA3E2FA|nr:fibronectin type III domain-containing protein [Natrinema sp. SYSU A 869]
MNDDIDTHDEEQFAETDRPTDTSTSRRTFMRAAGASAGALALGTSTVAAQADSPTVTVDIADEQIQSGETTTATVRLENSPVGSIGSAVEIALDPDVAQITEVEGGDYFPESPLDLEESVNEDIEEAGGSVSQLRVQPYAPDGINETGYEVATYHLEAQGEGTTEIELVDIMLTIPDGDNIYGANYDASTLTVGDVIDEPVTPAMPSDLEVVAENETSVEVAWSPVSNAVEYAVSVDGEQESTTTSSSATITGLEADTTYEIGVSALGEGDTMSETVTVQATTVTGAEPETPTLTVNLDDAVIDPGETTAVDLGLSEAPDGVVGFTIEVGIDPDVATFADAELGELFVDAQEMFKTVEVEDDYAKLKALDPVDAGTTDIEFGRIDLEGVADGETVVDVDIIRLEDNVDNVAIEPTVEEAMLTVGDGEPDSKPPSVPEDLEVVAETETSVEVAWSTDPNAIEYNVSVDGEQETTTTASSATVTDLESGTTYEIGVSAVGADDTETDAATVTATIAEANTPPSTPEGLEVVDETETSVEVAWSSDPNAVEYNVWVDGEQETTLSSTSTTVTDLESGTTYEIGVSAVGEDGTETDAATVTATTADTDDGDGNDGDYPEWDTNTLYQEGDHVHWNGENWVAQWTNKDKEPRYEDLYAWEPVDGEIPLEVDHLATIDPSATDVDAGERIDVRATDNTPDDIWIDGLQWDFDDGTTASGWHAGHSFDSSGAYTVTLTATDQRGRETTHEVEITVA